MTEHEPHDRLYVLDRADLQQLFDALHTRGYEVIAPQIENNVMIYGAVERVEELPIGWTDVQEGGTYRLERCNDAAIFGYTVGPHSWKRFLSPPLRILWRARKSADGFEFIDDSSPPPRYAFIGVRACELAAIQRLDDIYTRGAVIDDDYQARRNAAFIVAVNCGKAGNTCFCASLDTGPAVGPGYDLALTELLEGEHRFVVAVGSERGAEVLAELPHRVASEGEIELAEAVVAQAASQMGRTLETAGLQELLYRNIEHPHWDAVAERCLTCGNCTQVCPTCFCTSVEDHTDLAGQVAERTRRWDSCFTSDFSYLHGGSVRVSTLARYRQWLTHK
ncbi:MAG: 4Fe-4S dicluster domain-containing protein, partial [Caldilinea sp.]